MKKFFLSVALATLVLTGASAADHQPTYAAKQAFEKEFSSIKEVKWEEMNRHSGIYVASFFFNGETVQAIFTEDGDFLGTTRQVTKEQLPILLVKELNSKYTDEAILSIHEYSSPDGTQYYISVKTEKGAQLLKAAGNGQITTHKGVKK
jgi:opacity protein-like surface antigen